MYLEILLLILIDIFYPLAEPISLHLYRCGIFAGKDPRPGLIRFMSHALLRPNLPQQSQLVHSLSLKLVFLLRDHICADQYVKAIKKITTQTVIFFKFTMPCHDGFKSSGNSKDNFTFDPGIIMAG